MSRLLHTSDWHLGRALGRYSREEDFDGVLAEITAIARETEPDLIVHSGDLFDTSRPTSRDLIRAVRTLDDLAAIAPTVVVAGNHDSPGYFELLACLSGPSRGRGLFFIDKLRPAREGGVLTFDTRGGRQRIRLAVLPYVHPNRFWQRSSVSGTTPAAYAEGMRGLQRELMQALYEGHDPDRDVLVLAAHVFVAGASPSRSERHSDADRAFTTAPADLPEVAYAALGDIHAPQAVAGVPFAARYAGSPLQMDFGERGEAKSVVIVDADPGRPVRVMRRRLSAGRQLAVFEGPLEELRQTAHLYKGVFLKAVITDEEPDALLTRTVAEIVPHAILVSAAPKRPESDDALLEEAADEELNLGDAFCAYLTDQGMSGETAQSTASAFADLLGQLDEEAPRPVHAEELLRTALEDTWTEAS
ncbi:exonuclease SbcCD subunit D [Streptomyces sp. NPDC007983]|uniref:metallophosphoesterase family protein n=1 Tax=Streptomyces sp. NPDC007983 TaxID=3364800 RepID=UPI0036E9453B